MELTVYCSDCKHCDVKDLADVLPGCGRQFYCRHADVAEEVCDPMGGVRKYYSDDSNCSLLNRHCDCKNWEGGRPDLINKRILVWLGIIGFFIFMSLLALIE